MKKKEGKISWSEFNSYRECPYKFHLKLIDLGLDVHPNQEAMDDGKQFHKFCEKYFSVMEDKTIDEMVNGKFTNPDHQAFHEFETQRRFECKEKGIPWKPWGLEKTFYGSDTVCITDRIDDNGDGTFTLVEYKRSWSASSSVIQQLAFNYFTIKEALDIDITHFRIWYSKNPEKKYYQKVKKVSLNAMKKKMEHIIPAINAGVFFANAGHNCFYCDYDDKCNRIGFRVECGGCKK